jgi:hypothetical protein
VLDQVFRARQPDGPALFAVSGVSGGSLGAAGAMSLLSLEDRPCRAQGLPLLRPDKTVPLAGDAAARRSGAPGLKRARTRRHQPLLEELIEGLSLCSGAVGEQANRMDMEQGRYKHENIEHNEAQYGGRRSRKCTDPMCQRNVSPSKRRVTAMSGPIIRPSRNTACLAREIALQEGWADAAYR